MINGEKYFEAAISLTDRNPGTQFCDMLQHDSQVGAASRRYFRDEWRDLPLMGWNTFCYEMERAGQAKWLAKIKSLDADTTLRYLQTKLLESQRNGDNPNRGLLEATVKALQGVAAAAKITADATALVADAPKVEVVFFGEEGDPVSGYGELPAGVPDAPKGGVDTNSGVSVEV